MHRTTHIALLFFFTYSLPLTLHNRLSRVRNTNRKRNKTRELSTKPAQEEEEEQQQ